jgi:hypothetical protein
MQPHAEMIRFRARFLVFSVTFHFSAQGKQEKCWKEEHV